MTDFTRQISLEALIQVPSDAAVTQVAIEPWNERIYDSEAAVTQVCFEIWLVKTPSVPVSVWLD